MNRRPSLLSYRPKTSSAADDDLTPTASPPEHHAMKRTASQTFTNINYYDPRDAGMALDAVSETSTVLDGHAAHHSHASSLSRAFDAVMGRQKTRRRLSSFSSATTAPSNRRRGSIQSFIDSLPSSSAARKNSNEQQRMPLQHQDSGMPPYTQQSSSKGFFSKRFPSVRRRPTTSGTAPDFSGYATLVNPLPQQPVPGAAARLAAAAANQDRREQNRKEQDHAYRFINGLIPTLSRQDEDIKDNESGVDMTCSSLPVRADSVTDKKMSM